MSERTPTKRPSTSRARIPSHPELADQIVSDLREIWTRDFEDFIPTVGTVKAKAGGKRGRLHVEFDDEAGQTRQVPLPRGRGVKYENGDQVLIQKNRAGDWIAVAPIASGDSVADERGIDNDQLYDDSVDDRVIQDGKVTRKKLAPNAVGENELDQNSIKAGHINKDAVEESHLKGGIGKNKLSADVQKTLDNAATKKDVSNATSGLASKDYVGQQIKKIPSGVSKADFDKLKSDFQELKKKFDDHMTAKH